MNINLDVIAIVGPTASGKTALSIELAKRFNGEIINGDSTQIYKNFNIGTAKVTEEEMAGIPHHLLSIKNPTEPFSVAAYQTAVRKCIHEIKGRGKLPIIVGGTGLYIQAVLYDFRFSEEATDLAVRQALEKELEEKGAGKLYEKLMELDPVDAKKIHPNNYRRIIRALEIIKVTGKTKTEQEKDRGSEPLFNHLLFGLYLDRAVLYERINQRTYMMMEEGFLEEVKQLLEEGYGESAAMKAIGYGELQKYLEGTISYDEAIALIQQRTRQYAKRQMTYFRNKLNINWLNAEDSMEKIIREISNVLKDFQR